MTCMMQVTRVDCPSLGSKPTDLAPLQLELRPRTVVLDTRAHELATRRAQLATVEAFISTNECPGATQAMKESLDRQTSQFEEVRSRPFVGFTELTATPNADDVWCRLRTRAH